jgi:hypothetical protein
MVHLTLKFISLFHDMIGYRSPQLVVLTYIYDRLINDWNMSAVRAVSTRSSLDSSRPLPKVAALNRGYFFGEGTKRFLSQSTT